MHKSLHALAAIAIALAVGTHAVPAQARDASVQVTSLSAASKKHPVKRRAVKRDTRQVACTFLGCQRIPRNCHPTPGFNWWTGEPTGFDVIVCR